MQRKTSGLKLVGADGLSARVQETFHAIARRAFEIFESNGRTFGHDLEDSFNSYGRVPEDWPPRKVLCYQCRENAFYPGEAPTGRA